MGHGGAAPAGDIRQIGGYQGQNARGNKRKKTGRESDQERGRMMIHPEYYPLIFRADRISFSKISRGRNPTYLAMIRPLASRTKELNFSYVTSILVTQNTIDKIGDAFLTRRVENVAVYGKEIPIYVHEVLRTKASANTIDIQRVEQYNIALELMLTGRFEQAIVEFDLLDPLNDSVVAKKKLQAKRLLDGDEREWDGVVTMELK